MFLRSVHFFSRYSAATLWKNEIAKTSLWCSRNCGLWKCETDLFKVSIRERWKQRMKIYFNRMTKYSRNESRRIYSRLCFSRFFFSTCRLSSFSCSRILIDFLFFCPILTKLFQKNLTIFRNIFFIWWNIVDFFVLKFFRLCTRYWFYTKNEMCFE